MYFCCMKVCLLGVLFFSTINLSAQYIGNPNFQLIPVSFHYSDVERSGNAMTVNYDQSDEFIWGLNYKRALLPIHRGYDANDSLQNIVYASYTLDSLIKPDNSYILPFANVSGLVLDSLDIELGHVKYSAFNDTLILTLVQLDTVNFPGGPSLYADTIILNAALSAGNILTNTVALRWKPNYIMNNQPIGVRIEFTGSLQDTLALMAGYGIYPSPNSCTVVPLDKARKSFFYPNSYAYWSNYNMILPTNIQGDLFYDCNGNIIKDTSDSENYAQNWSITSYVSAPAIGIETEYIYPLTIYPNPAGNIIYIKGVDIIAKASVYNSTGACIKVYIEPNYIDVSDLNNGIYIFTFQYENQTVHKKVVIQR